MNVLCIMDSVNSVQHVGHLDIILKHYTKCMYFVVINLFHGQGLINYGDKHTFLPWLKMDDVLI